MSDAKLIREYALDALSRREHSRFELTQKLLVRGFSSDAIAATLDQLANAGYLSDTRFTEAYIRSRVQRGYGPLRIMQELRQRGITEMQHIDENDAAWLELACVARRKRFGETLPSSAPEKLKQVRFLTYRGFTPAHCWQATRLEIWHD